MFITIVNHVVISKINKEKYLKLVCLFLFLNFGSNILYK